MLRRREAYRETATMLYGGTTRANPIEARSRSGNDVLPPCIRPARVRVQRANGTGDDSAPVSRGLRLAPIYAERLRDALREAARHGQHIVAATKAADTPGASAHPCARRGFAVLHRATVPRSAHGTAPSPTGSPPNRSTPRAGHAQYRASVCTSCTSSVQPIENARYTKSGKCCHSPPPCGHVKPCPLPGARLRSA